MQNFHTIKSSAGASCAALLASCCIIPAVLASIGLGSAAASIFEPLLPYQHYLLGFAIAAIAYAHWNSWQAKKDCAAGTCASPSKLSKVLLWVSTAAVAFIIAEHLGIVL